MSISHWRGKAVDPQKTSDTVKNQRVALTLFLGSGVSMSVSSNVSSREHGQSAPQANLGSQEPPSRRYPKSSASKADLDRQKHPQQEYDEGKGEGKKKCPQNYDAD